MIRSAPIQLLLSAPLLQFNSSGAVTERDLLGLNPAGVDAIMAQEAVDGTDQGGAVTWMVDDNLGSDRNVVNNNGSVVDTTVYNAFGQTASQSNPSATAWTGFASGHNDASTSMVLDAERAYNPTTGGWNSKDPIGLPVQLSPQNRVFFQSRWEIP